MFEWQKNGRATQNADERMKDAETELQLHECRGTLQSDCPHSQVEGKQKQFAEKDLSFLDWKFSSCGIEWIYFF